MYFPVLLQMLNIILTESYKIFVKNRDLIYMTRFQIVPTQQDISDIASITAMVEAAQADRHPTAVETPEQSSVQCAGGFRNRSIIPTFLSCSTCEARVHKKCIKTTSYNKYLIRYLLSQGVRT